MHGTMSLKYVGGLLKKFNNSLFVYLDCPWGPQTLFAVVLWTLRNSKAAQPLASVQCQGLEGSELYFCSSINLHGVKCDNFTLPYIKILKVQYY